MNEASAAAARPPIRLACTTVLIRDAAPGLEVLLLQRDPNARFLPGHFVFPGGAVAGEDHTARGAERIRGIDHHAANARLGLDADALAFWLAAVRETFEECAILLAVDEAHCDLPPERYQALLARRQALNAGSQSFVELLSEHRLYVPGEALVYFDHWLTPAGRPRRFDTRFFLARVPPGQSVSHDGAEIVDARWMQAGEALSLADAKEMQIAHATRATLQMLARHSSVDHALAAARSLDEIEFNRPCIAQGSAGTKVFQRRDAAYHEIHWCDPLESMQTTYDVVPGVAKTLDRHVTRVVAPNPGPMTGRGTNTYFVGERELAVIDPGPADDRHVASLLAHADGRLRWILCTHTHRDHSPAAALLAKATGAQVIGMPAPDDPGHDTTFAPDRVARDGERLQLGDVALTAVHTPGHASNHLCFLFEPTRMLFTGDHMMQGSTVVITPPDGDMRQYLASLERLLGLDIAVVAPGHGYLIGEPHREVRRLIEHRHWREARVLDAVLRKGPAVVDEMVDDVYPGLLAVLRPAAARSLLAHLNKLVADGAVREDAGRYTAATPR